MNIWQKMEPESKEWVEFLQWYVRDHFMYQQPRILELERYYQADNNIHYWISGKNKKKHADNRIASAIARYITNIQVGYEFGTPLKFGYTNTQDKSDDGEAIREEIDNFNQQNDEPYHEKIMAKNLSNTGRSFELVYVPKDEKQPKIASIDPNSAFVVYSTDIDPVELFGVRYYAVNVLGELSYQVEVYTDDHIYYYSAGSKVDSDWELVDSVEHYFQMVPLTEFKMNEERIGLWEPELDKIDTVDQSLSEMANSQEDFSNATLIVSGKIANKSGKTAPMLDEAGKPVYMKKDGSYTSKETNEDGTKNSAVMIKRVLDTHGNVTYLQPYVYDQPNGSKLVSNTTAQYLTKSLDASEWKIFVDQLLSDIHKETNTPDTSDQNFAANASGVAMAYKLWGTDQEMSFSETLYTRGVRRRLRMLAIQWSNLNGSKVKVTDDLNPADNIQITYTPNLPKNNQETMQIVQQLVTSGVVSKETLREQVSTVTGIPADQEAQRVEDEDTGDDEDTSNMIASAIQKLHANNLTDEDGDDDGNGQTNKEKDSTSGKSGQQEQQDD